MNNVKFIIEMFKKKHPGLSPDIEDLVDLLWFRGNSLDMLMYSHVVWPEFTEIEGTIVLSYTVTLEEERTDLIKMIKNKQWPINDGVVPYTCLELYPIFFHNENKDIEEEDDEKIYTNLADLIHECWSVKLTKDFPNRKFVVHKSSE